MELSRFTDYSIRLLIFAGTRSGRPVSLTQVADAYQISYHHLTKIAHQLRTLGYIESVRGRDGGFSLAREPADICIGDLVRTLETLDIVECLKADGGQCVIAGPCALTHAIREARESFLTVLDRYTLGDLLKPRRALLERFEASAPNSHEST